MRVVLYQNFLIVFIFIGSCACLAQEHDPITIHLIGDSTMADYSDNYDPGKDYMQTRYPLTGWGQVFQALFTKKSVTLVSNLIEFSIFYPVVYNSIAKLFNSSDKWLIWQV